MKRKVKKLRLRSFFRIFRLRKIKALIGMLTTLFILLDMIPTQVIPLDSFVKNARNIINVDSSAITNSVNNLKNKSSGPKGTGSGQKDSGPGTNLKTAKIHYIDVGQGDSELIQINNRNILIDTGEKSESKSLIQYLKKQKVKTLDAFIITHPHTDHMGAAVNVLDSIKVKKIYMTDYVHTTRSYEELLIKVKEKGLKITRAKEGVSVDVGKNATAKIISPGKSYEDINSSSIVLELTYQDNIFLFTGDATIETEKDILSNGYGKKIDVLKVAHHGSKYSNSSTFLNAFLDRSEPSIAIISSGKDNTYKHPHSSVIKRLKKNKAIILNTSEKGTIIVTSDGKEISYQTEK